MTESNKIPLCVDLDGTLIKTDALFESVLLLIKKNPFYIFFLPIWLAKGKPNLKKEMYSRIDFPVNSLPYNQELIEYIKTERNSGRKVYLVTASHQIIADKVSEYLGIFDDSFGTSDTYNLKAGKKRDFLVDKFGDGGFVYAGDSKADFKVWENAIKAVVVSRKNSFLKSVNKQIEVEKSFIYGKSLLATIIKEIRVYQWVKNILLFLPLLLAHQLTNEDKITDLIIAFISFSISASFVYVLNDLLDLESDRSHPRKKNRPLASGSLPVQLGILLVPILLISGLGLSFLVNAKFQLILLTYLVLTTAYSFKLKKIAILDIVILAALFTTRVISGGFAAEVDLSMWILAFSMFFFMNLAVLKRYTELLVIKKKNKLQTKGRGYHIEDMGLLLSVGPAAGFMAVLVFALYISSEQAQKLYNFPELLWLVSPILLFWIIRIWHLCVRGKMTDDPIVFTVKDRVSYLIGILIFILSYFAT